MSASPFPPWAPLLSPSSVLFGTLALLSLWYVATRLMTYQQNLKISNYHPGPRALLSSESMLANILPRVFGLNHTVMSWRSKRAHYDRYRTSIVAQISLLSGKLTYVCSTPLATTPLNHLRRSYIKPISAYKILTLYGSNLVTTEGAEWRRHRKVAAPGFNEGVFELVWDTMQEVWWEMANEEGVMGLEEGGEKLVKDIPEITLRLALAVLSTASFGAPLSWNPTPPIESSSNTITSSTPPISFTEAISIVSSNIIFVLLFPKWALRHLPFAKFKEVGRADEALRAYMYGMIKTRREALKRGEEPKRRDLFGELIGASLNEDEEKIGGDGGMTDEELVGNTFIFTLAGHETSAHTLAFAFAYLSLDPSIQTWLHEELDSVLPAGHTPTYKDYPKLSRTLAVLYETMRLCPPVILIPKVAAEDSWLEDDGEDVYTRDGADLGRTEEGVEKQKKRVFVPKGTGVNIDVLGLHRHPKYWPDPHTFKPERFTEEYDKDAFLPFSAGPRGCVGRRFAEVESVLAIALTCRHFDLLPRPLKPGETEAERAIWLLDAKNQLTLTPKHVDLVFRRRKGGAVKRKEWIEE